jgi:hypothetical protein
MHRGEVSRKIEEDPAKVQEIKIEIWLIIFLSPVFFHISPAIVYHTTQHIALAEKASFEGIKIENLFYVLINCLCVQSITACFFSPLNELP